MITDILDNFGNLVADRIQEKAVRQQLRPSLCSGVVVYPRPSYHPRTSYHRTTLVSPSYHPRTAACTDGSRRRQASVRPSLPLWEVPLLVPPTNVPTKPPYRCTTVKPSHCGYQPPALCHPSSLSSCHPRANTYRQAYIQPGTNQVVSLPDNFTAEMVPAHVRQLRRSYFGHFPRMICDL